MSKKTKKIIVIAVVLVIAAGAAIGGYFWWDIREYNRIIDGISLETPDLALIQDGVFSGSFDARLVSAEVEVTMLDNLITNAVIINHDHGNWDDAVRAEVVVARVVEAQNLYVDTVANATNSSLVILAAIQNALESAQEGLND